MYKSKLESVGIKLPEKRVSTKDLMSQMKHRVNIDLEKITGIRERRVCSENESSFTLAVDAANDCLKYSKYRPEELDVIIYCAITKSTKEKQYIYEPSMSFYIKNSIGAVNALNFDVTNACAGMMTGIIILDDFIQRGIAIGFGITVSIALYKT